MPVLLAPLGEVRQRLRKLLAGRATLQMCFAAPILAPAKLKTQELKAGFGLVPTERDDPRLLSGQGQQEFPQALTQRFVEGFGVLLLFECAHKVVRVSSQARLTVTALLDNLFKPQIKRVVQGHVG